MTFLSVKSGRGAVATTILCVMIAGGVSGCEGGAPAGPATEPTCSQGGEACSAAPSAPAIWRASRLSSEQLARTFEAVLGAVPASMGLLPADESDVEAKPPPSAFEVDLYRQIADEAAEAGASKLVENGTCGSDAECLEQAFLELAERAYRGPLDAVEQRTYTEVLKEGNDAHSSVRAALAILFQAPRFLYAIEGGVSGDGSETARELTAWELAARLSYFIWSEPPDITLRQAAASGRLADEAILRAQAQRMLADKKAARAFGSTLRMWAAPGLSSIAKADTAYPEFGPSVRAAMIQQFDEFAAMALREGASLRQMLTTAQMPVDAQLAQLLGLPAPDGQSWQTASLPAPRFGLLTLPGTLTANAGAADSSPVLRGLFVREKLLCQGVPPPPPDVPSLPPPRIDSKASARERLEAHTQNAVCASCHKRMDPLGFPFEIYDGLGRLRPEAAQLRTDGTLSDVEHPSSFKDLAGLTDALTASSEVSRCWTSQWLMRATGSEAHGTATLDELSERVLGGLSWADLIVEIVATPTFRRIERRAGE